jgi:hypothetical protein
MPMHLGASRVQKVSKMRLGAVQTLPRIFWIFSGIYSHFPRAISIY